MIFDWFKKKEAPDNIDPTNITLRDLRKGFILEYDLKSYKVAKCFEYDWGNNFYADEYQLVSGDDTVYLYVQVDDELECSITRPISFFSIMDGLDEIIRTSQKPPGRLTYKGTLFFRNNEEAGNLRDKDTENWEQFIAWNYSDESKKMLLTIEQWGDDDFEAHLGYKAKEYEFSNLLPGIRQ